MRYDTATRSEESTCGIMIDAPDTADRDDAIWVRAVDDGYDAWVHIALIADALPVDSDADRDARRRMRSRYLPDRTIGMLPPEIEDAASLRPGGQDTMCVYMGFSAGGELLDSRIFVGRLDRSWIVSYGQASSELRDPTRPLHHPLSTAHRLATALLRRRRSAGALAFYDLFQGYATNEEGQLVRLGENQRHAGYVIVQELMIAANATMAMWSAARDIPILYRNHRSSTVAGERSEILAELAAVEALADTRSYELLRGRMGVVQRAATYQAAVFGHYGLNLPAYTHATSPLRRYSDLVNQRILVAAAQGIPAPYRLDELTDIAGELNDGARRQREQSVRHHRETARKETAARLASQDFAGLDTAMFGKVLRLAVGQPTPSPGLVDDAARRLAAAELPIRDQCEILFRSVGDDWQVLRQDINAGLAEEPSKALTIVNMYAQAVLGGPVNDEHITWELDAVGTVRKPCFRARMLLNLNGSRHCSPARIQASKKDAKAQAALALVADLAGVADLSTSIDPPDRTTNPTARLNPVPAGRNPTMAINEYCQQGALSEVTWEYTRSGPAHEPVFTCTARALLPDRTEPVVTIGTGSGKQAAKTAAAAALRRRIEDMHRAPSTP